MAAVDLYKDAVPLQTNNLNIVMVLAPHADDESLGCGGTIALLSEQHKKVYVVFITDGSMSHPNSKKYPSEKLAAVRKAEAISALHELGVEANNIFFLHKKDRHLPACNEPGFKENAEALMHIIESCKPELIFVPYEKDPHPDHRATWQMLMYIRKNYTINFSVAEYLIWLYNLGEEKDFPKDDFTCRFTNIKPYLIKKQKAIAQHKSQTTHLIDDDPQGFILTPDVLQHFNNDKEFFLDRNL